MTADETGKPGNGAAPGAPASDAARLRFIEAAKVVFSRAGARLDATLEGDKTYEKVTVRRAFPLSAPASHYSIRDSDNKEIGILRGIENMDAESRRLLDGEIERRYMIPVVKRVVKVTERFGTVDWEVDTDRGRCRFTTRDLRENAIRVGASHYLLTDVENNRFEVPDLNALDANSQSSLIRHL